MDQTHRQLDWDRIARSLDGDADPLPEAEARAAREIREDLAFLGRRMDVEADNAVLLRVGARLETALANGPRPALSIRLLRLASVAAAAAAVLIAAAVLLRPPGTQPPESAVRLTDEEAIAAFVDDEPGAIDIQLDMLDEQAASLEADIRLEEVSALDLEMEAVGEQIENFWLDPLAAELDADTEM